ncbi:unnamed protein product [Zymoseptoria tritici ST99CH_3D7]|uniref:Uncharacterized protein n=1 Tax=Zymoseptoria tritici (strain ST99CH_3D7) TaxID=1276538 RepID=A0A1X7RJF9_ZYMT9|nr:unnamed protein product [Zymoseptoria tritici ST99CH_3D7]
MSSSPLSTRPRRISVNAGEARPSPPSPRSPSQHSLAAAATINAGLHRSDSRPSPTLERRRSSMLNSIALNDPTIPAPGEMQPTNGSSHSGSPRVHRGSFNLHTADPNHHRHPSLGSLHRELENEQEAQVNRLLHMIRMQQDQIAAIQHQRGEPSPVPVDGNRYRTISSASNTPASAAVMEQSPPLAAATSAHVPRGHINRPHSLSRESSAWANSGGTSPALTAQSGTLAPLTEDFLLGGTRDDCAFYQAETSSLTRENQMLKKRVAELERQIADMEGKSSAPNRSDSTPATHSPLAAPPSNLPATGSGTSTE